MAWKTWLGVGCSHGSWADPTALETVLKFKRVLKPHVTFHLGDYLDLAALRGGANEQDRNVDLVQDIALGTKFLQELRPNVIFMGNHEDRIAKALTHPNKALQFVASKINDEVEALAKKLHASVVPYDLETGWRFPLGSDTSVGHGYMFNENALRDHAEYRASRQTIIAHLHTPGIANGRRSDHPIAYCSGYLGDASKFTYAKTNKSKAKWNQGFLWGEFNETTTIIRLEQKVNGIWRLPL